MGESLRDQLSAAFDNAETVVDTTPVQETVSDAVVTTDAVTQEAKPASPPPITATETETQRAQRARDEHGRFKEGKAPVQPAQQVTQSATTAAPLQRPSSWKKELWSVWDKMASGQPLNAQESRQVAEYNLEREGHFAKGVSTYKAEADAARPFVDAIQPFMPLLQQHGVHPATWIQNLGNAHRMLATGNGQQKLQAFARLAQDYNIPLQAFTDQAAQQQYLAQSQQPPQNQSQGALTQADVERLAESKFIGLEAQREVARFTADGKHEHYETVKETMARLLEAGEVHDLESAYDAALRLPRHADIYAAVQQQQQAANDAQRREAEAAKVRTARARAISPATSTPSGNLSGDKPQGLRSQLEASFDAHTSGRV